MNNNKIFFSKYMNDNKIFDGALIDAIVTSKMKHIFDPVSGNTTETLVDSSDEMYAALLTLRYGVIKISDSLYCALNINDDKDFKGNIIKLNNIGGKTDPIFLNKGNWSKTILYDDSKRTHETENYDGINIKELADADYDTYERCSINAKRIINVRSSKILKMVLNE